MFYKLLYFLYAREKDNKQMRIHYNNGWAIWNPYAN